MTDDKPQQVDVPYVGIGRLIDAPEPEAKKPEFRVYDSKDVVVTFNGIELKPYVDEKIEVTADDLGRERSRELPNVTFTVQVIGATHRYEWVFLVPRSWEKRRKRRIRMARKKRRGWA